MIFLGGLGMEIMKKILGRKIEKGKYKWIGMVIDNKNRGGYGRGGGLGGGF